MLSAQNVAIINFILYNFILEKSDDFTVMIFSSNLLNIERKKKKLLSISKKLYWNKAYSIKLNF